MSILSSLVLTELRTVAAGRELYQLECFTRFLILPYSLSVHFSDAQRLWFLLTKE